MSRGLSRPRGRDDVTARRWRAAWLLLVPGLLSGCAPTLEQLPDVGCKLDEANSSALPAPVPANGAAAGAQPSSAGQMTPAAAAAKRLFDAERWTEAEQALRAVMSGSTGDDDGNRELAQYHLAIALIRLRRPADALPELESMALDLTHLKHSETLLWLARLFVEPDLRIPTLRLIGVYEDDHVQRFNNAQQRDLYEILSLAQGRARFRAGDWDGAASAPGRVSRGSRWYVAARQCQEYIRAVSPR